MEQKQQQTTRELRGMVCALEALRHQTGNANLTLPQILTLLAVGIKSDVPQSELEQVTQLSGTGVSRVLFDQLGPGGMNLVTTRQDSENRRKSIVSLTPQGRRVISAMSIQLQKLWAGE